MILSIIVSGIIAWLVYSNTKFHGWYLRCEDCGVKVPVHGYKLWIRFVMYMFRNDLAFKCDLVNKSVIHLEKEK